MASELPREREFVFTDTHFRKISQLVGDSTGIRLTEAKKDMVYSRLARRLRQVGMSDFGAYLEFVENDESEQELAQLVNAITTNLTAFFRENHHFEYLKNNVIPELLERNGRERRIRIWSAGCSTGEEPYSIAMAVREAMLGKTGWDVRILATDLDSEVVATAQAGVYTTERVQAIDKKRLSRWFMRGAGESSGRVKVKPEIQQLITFKQLNLLHQWPFKGPFDVIFCRNVVIYFSKDTQRELFNRYADILRHDGALFIGHSESLFKVSDRFTLIGNTIYRKIK